MKVSFLNSLRVEKRDADRWALSEPLSVLLDTAELDFLGIPGALGMVLTVPAGFEMDFASVPRIPIAFWLAGDTAHRAGVVHDYLYAMRAPRDLADKVFDAAMKSEGVPGWRRSLMYAAVRAFGGSHYASKETEQETPDTPA